MNNEYQKIIKLLTDSNKALLSISKENKEIKKILSGFESKLEILSAKIEEFEIIMDAAEIIEEHQMEEENMYNTDWNPYDDEDYSPEYYEEYNEEDDDEF